MWCDTALTVTSKPSFILYIHGPFLDSTPVSVFMKCCFERLISPLTSVDERYWEEQMSSSVKIASLCKDFRGVMPVTIALSRDSSEWMWPEFPQSNKEDQEVRRRLVKRHVVALSTFPMWAPESGCDS